MAVHISDPRTVDSLERLYSEAERRIAQQIHAAIGTGAQFTEAQRRSQLAAVRAELRQLRNTGRILGGETLRVAYTAAVANVDRSLGGGAFSLREFSGVHTEALTVLAANMDRPIAAAFQRVGRHVDDAFRAASLEEVGLGIAGGQGRRTVSAALQKRLIDEHITDALTGFVDAGGRRWSLGTYARMVARTTTREAASRGTSNRLLEHDLDLVTVSEHADSDEECDEFAGNTYSLDGRTPGYEVLDTLPPFHPNCIHVLTPAAENLERAFSADHELATA